MLEGVTVNYQYGLWGVVLGYLAVVAGGIVNMRSPLATAFTAEAASGLETPLLAKPPVTNLQLGKLNFDIATLRKAARLPLIVVAGLCLIVLINASLGSFWDIAFTLAWAFAGVVYARTALAAGASLRATDLALNGGALGAGAALAYTILVQIVLAIQSKSSSFDLISTLATLIEAFVIAALAAVAWYAYQGEQARTPVAEEPVEQVVSVPLQ